MRRHLDPLILLAGGKSERAGEPKGLREFRGHAWLAEQLERFRFAGGTRAVVVLGYAPERYARALEEIEIPGLQIEHVLNERPERGPFSSIQCGLRVLSTAAFVQPVDVPCPEPEVWRDLSRAREGVLAGQPRLEERGGHPVWISADFARELLSRPPESRLDDLLRALPARAVAKVESHDPSVRLNLNTPEQWNTFRERSRVAVDIELGHDAGLLSLVEAGLGSVLHALHVPGGGHLLSLNQGFLLSKTTLRTRERSAGMRVSAVAGLLKSLSPAGKKLTPMLAISVQGLLFSLGTTLFGANVFGACIGAALLSVWAFAQPLLISYLIFGKSLFTAAQVLFDRTSELFSFPRADLVQIVFWVTAIKVVISILLALAAAALPETLVLRYVSRLRAIALKPPQPRPGVGHASAPAAGALKDVSRPVFLFPLLLTFAFLLFSESPHAAILWGLLRPFALGYAFFLGLRLISLDSLADRLELQGHTSISRVLKGALRYSGS